MTLAPHSDIAHPATDVDAWKILAVAADGPHAALHDLAQEHGPQTAVELLINGTLDGHTELAKAAARAQATDLRSVLRTTADVHARIITRADAEWPSALVQLGEHEPFALWLRGARPDALAAKIVCLTGARACSSYGDHLGGILAQDLAEEGITTITGGGYGIDATAARGSLAAGGTTIVVLACGIDRMYPAGHQPLFADVLDRGLIITEHAPGVVPAKTRFLSRNRIMAALGQSVTVVEAGRRSGAVNTMAWARSIGKPVGALPGPVTSAVSAGANDAIRDGLARCVTSAADIIALSAT